MKKTGIPLLVLLLPAACPAASIFIAFHNGATTAAAMTTRPAGSVVDTGSDTWNNIQNNGGVGLSFSGVGLSLSDGSASAATVSATSGFASFNNNNWGAGTQDAVMMEGWYGFRGSETITVANLPAEFTNAGYTVTVYGDSNVTNRTMNFTLDDGGGPSTLTITDSGTFSGTFSEGDNFVTFSGLSGAGFTLRGNPGAADPRSAISGIVITTVPEPGSAALGLLGALLLVRRRS